MTFNIVLESKAPDAQKWEKHHVETSHWPSAEPMLADAQRRFPTHRFRLVAELNEDEKCEP